MVGGWDERCALYVRCVHGMKHQTTKQKFLVCQQGQVGAELGTSGPVASIKLKSKDYSYASGGR